MYPQAAGVTAAALYPSQRRYHQLGPVAGRV